MNARIVQVSDLHLFAEPDTALYGVVTRPVVRAVLDYVRDRLEPFDRLVITGDLAHDERLETYHVLREMLGTLVERCLLIPGNHDDRSFMRDVYGDRLSNDQDRIVFSESLGEWRLIGLDSHVPGEVAGRLGADQLQWLRQELDRHAGQPTVLFVHHPPISVDSPWLDAIALLDADAFATAVAGRSNVRAICMGHIHHEFVGALAGIPVWSVPAACVQFRPGTETPEYDSEALPGVRVIDLGEAHLESRVVRIDVDAMR